MFSAPWHVLPVALANPAVSSTAVKQHGPHIMCPQTTFSGGSLTPQEQALLAALPRYGEPAQVIMFSDPGFDVDDETAMVVAGALQKRGLIELKAFVATTEPSLARALLAKGALKELGMGTVPVSVGLNHTPQDFSPEAQRLQAPFTARPEEVENDTQALLQRTFQSAPDKSLTLLLIANMADAATFLENNDTLFTRKVKHVVVMGGVNQTSEETDETAQDLKRNANGFLQANTLATNNRHHQASADFLYPKIQELGIPLTVITQKAATATPIRPEFFQDLAETGQAVARHLQTIEGDFLNKFWQAACTGKMGPQRNGAWFKKAFCKPNTPDTLTPQEDIRPHLKNRVLYDAIALLACVEGLSAQLFNPVTVTLQNTVHQIIGLSSRNTGLADAPKLATLLSALAKDGLSAKTKP